MQRAEGDQKGRSKVNHLADPAVAEQHHAEKTRFQKECGQHLITEQRAGDIADALHVARPVGAELKAHGDAADDPERECQGEYFCPKPVGAQPIQLLLRIGRAQVLQPKKQQNPAQRDRNRGEQNVERDIGGELDARKEHNVHQHSLQLRRSAFASIKLASADTTSLPLATRYQWSFTCGSVRRVIRRASVSSATFTEPCSACSCIL